MEITYTENPLNTVILVNEEEKKEMRYKLMIELLYDKIYGGAFYLKDGEYYNIDEAKKCLDAEDVEKECDQLLEWYVAELKLPHIGDCICFPASCGKCYGEDLLGISTLKGLPKHSANKIDVAFRKYNNREDVLNHLKNYIPHIDDPKKWERMGGYEQYIPRWKEEAKSAYEWLSNYYAEHFNGEVK